MPHTPGKNPYTNDLIKAPEVKPDNVVNVCECVHSVACLRAHMLLAFLNRKCLNFSKFHNVSALLGRLATGCRGKSSKKKCFHGNLCQTVMLDKKAIFVF